MLELDLEKSIEEKLIDVCNSKNISISDYISEVLNKEFYQLEKLTDKFYFNKYKNLVCNKKDETIELTKTQLKIIKFLLTKRGEYISSETIIKNCWSRKKETSIFTFRNMIKQIRDKTEYDIIKRKKNLGYKIE